MPDPRQIMASHQTALEALNQGQPQPQGSPGPDQGALKKLWGAIGDPRVQMWMLSAGNRLLNPQRGESQFARFSNAITQGYDDLGAAPADDVTVHPAASNELAIVDRQGQDVRGRRQPAQGLPLLPIPTLVVLLPHHKRQPELFH